MRIQHNISALNSHRQLGVNTSASAKNLEKLSSGYRINRAGDDAAGLAISEKMRGQIRGLDMAQKNAQDGISLIQTAEGALNETHSILQRMRELAVQSSNGTYQDEVDRDNLNKEVTALKSEIDRISSATHFNKINLLDGSLSGSGATSAVSSVKSDDISFTTVDATKHKVTSAAITGTIAKTESDGSSLSFSFTYEEDGTSNSKTTNITLTLGTNADGDRVLVGSSGKEYAIADFANQGVQLTDTAAALNSELAKSPLAEKMDIAIVAAGTGTFEAKTAGSNGAKLVSIAEVATKSDGTVTTKSPALTNAATGADEYYTAAGADFTVYDGTNKLNDCIVTINGKKFAIAKTADDAKKFGSDVNVAIGAAFANAGDELASLIQRETGLEVKVNGTNLEFKPGSSTSSKGGVTFQIGANGTEDQRVTLNIRNMSSKGIGVDGISIADRDSANAAIDVVDNAINIVSSTRADLGAVQNRLEHTINNLGVTSENLSAAESRIRDVDMAKEMMEFTKNNILTQAAQAMLAQANQQPQGILQLLQ